MSVLCPTPDERLLDARGRPYFLWDVDLTLEQFLAHLRSADEAERAACVGKLLRQAKPDDVFRYVRVEDIVRLWPRIVGYLGTTRDFWAWVLGVWGHRVGA